MDFWITERDWERMRTIDQWYTVVPNQSLSHSWASFITHHLGVTMAGGGRHGAEVYHRGSQASHSQGLKRRVIGNQRGFWLWCLAVPRVKWGNTWASVGWRVSFRFWPSWKINFCASDQWNPKSWWLDTLDCKMILKFIIFDGRVETLEVYSQNCSTFHEFQVL